jgi:hypothetical protein
MFLKPSVHGLPTTVVMFLGGEEGTRVRGNLRRNAGVRSWGGQTGSTGMEGLIDLDKLNGYRASHVGDARCETSRRRAAGEGWSGTV